MSKKTGTIDIVVERILPILATSLYGDDPKCAIRELALQNPHDALWEASDDAPPSYQPAIHVYIDRDNKAIVVEDNGIGMTEDEVVNNLARIGGTSKQEIDQIKAEEGSESLRTKIEERIGKFGMGFLAGFIIAKAIKVQTRRGNAPAVEAEFTGGSSFSYGPCDRTATGAAVTLYLKDDFLPLKAEPNNDLLNTDRLSSILREYGNLLRYPVFVHRTLDDAGTRINVDTPPWISGATVARSYQNFYKQRYQGMNEPLVIIPVSCRETIALRNGEEKDLRIGGLLYVPNPPPNEMQEYGAIDLYVKRLFVCHDRDGLLPAWATYFVNGLIDTPSLTETLDRNDVVRTDRMFVELRRKLGEILIQELKEMNERRPQDFANLMQVHGERIRRAALDDHEEFFDAIAPCIPVMIFSKEFTGGREEPFGRYIEEYAEEDDEGRKVISFFSHASRGMLQDLISQDDRVVIDATDPSYKEFIWQFAARNKNTTVLDDITRDLTRYVMHVSPKEEQKWQQFISFFQTLTGEGMDVQASVNSFEPHQIPALLLAVDKNAKDDEITELSMFMEQTKGTLPAVRDALQQALNKARTTTGFRLFINAKNTLMCDLLDFAREHSGAGLPKEVELMLHEIFHNARLYSGQPHNTAVALHIFEYHNDLIGQYLKALKANREAVRSQREYSQERTEWETRLASMRNDYEAKIKKLNHELNVLQEVLREHRLHVPIAVKDRSLEN